MKEITLNQIKSVSGGEMTTAQSNESWARTMGVLGGFVGFAGGAVVGGAAGPFILDVRASGVPVAIGGVLGAAVGGVVAHLGTYAFWKTTLDYINFV